MNYNNQEFEGIIATPSCDKSYLCDKYPQLFVDVDEERLKLKYFVPEGITRAEYEATKGARTFERRMKEFDYISALYKLLDEKREQGMVLIAAPHPESYEYFASRNIKYCFVYAGQDVKEEIKRRYLMRGNLEEMTERDCQFFETFFEGNIKDERATVKYAFSKDEYLEDILKKFGMKMPDEI